MILKIIAIMFLVAVAATAIHDSVCTDEHEDPYTKGLRFCKDLKAGKIEKPHRNAFEFCGIRRGNWT